MSTRIKVVYVKHALIKSKLPVDYALNPYRGCAHGCLYCYSPYVLRERREWGTFVDVKRNIPTVLGKELRTAKKGVVAIGTVTDAYQQVEEDYKLTRRCLTQLLKHDFPITIQTKSSLVLRDLDLIRRFSTKDIGVTITTHRDEDRMKYEPASPSIENRLSALAQIDIPKWAFVGPIMPGITELTPLIRRIKETNTRTIFFDKLRLKGNWDLLERMLSREFPHILPEYKRIYFSKNSYWEEKKSEIRRVCKAEKIVERLCF